MHYKRIPETFTICPTSYLRLEMLKLIRYRYRTLLMPKGELVEVRRPMSDSRERLSNSFDGGKELVLFRLYCDSDGEGG